MSDSIFLFGNDGSLTEASSAAYDAEAELQKLLADHVQLLPGAQIDQDSPRRWLLVKREAGVPNREGGAGWWSVDHLVVDQDGVPTFVEVKRASDTRARRDVVAQMLDYAANGSAFWTPEQLRAWFEGDDPGLAMDRLMECLGAPDEDPEDAADAFWQTVGVNLREGRIRLIFVADEIPATLQRLVEFLNEQMPRVEVLAVEIRQFRADAGGLGALVPRLLGQTARAQAVKEAGPRRPNLPRRSVPWTADEVVEFIAQMGSSEGAVAKLVTDWAKDHPHVQIAGGVGLSYPSVTMSADTTRSRSRLRGVLSLYGSPNKGEKPMLEVRVKRMCRTPPYNQAEMRDRLMADLRALGTSRLDAERNLAEKRPNVPLDELTNGRAGRLLALVDKWIEDVRAHAGEPEGADPDE